MNNLPDWGFAGAGVMLLIGIVIYLTIFALVIWIFYLIIRAAVTNGIMRARERGAFNPPPGQGGYQPGPSPMRPGGDPRQMPPGPYQ
ncbi:hypothetical protein GCG21_12450 [Pseudactinotalea sp. HY160]|uniref:hypothetical protein n=1 Tax=Pseudactinotalea sp. HY160 TaxID=2654490 RepID=UPI00128E5B96|nr:hypothetical protein [Pseudactinotalea sp. HY160]MPV50804.1 hypothetical protein [Pseudactinotalea sp. HY160]